MARALIQRLQKRECLRAFPFFVCLLCVLSGCDQLDQLKAWLEQAAPTVARKQKAKEASGAVELAGNLRTPGERFAFYRWLVKEMQEQIFAVPLGDPRQVNSWANVLLQRGTLEGVYHGMVYSAVYGARETGKTELPAVRFFASEMAALDAPLAAESDPELQAARARYAKEHLGSSLFTLKRLLGERILEESAKRKGNGESLAAWYAPFAAKWSRVGVPLGNEQRMRTEETFHYGWAQGNSLGLVQWELLNRAHRILNSLGGRAVPVAATPATTAKPTAPAAPAAPADPLPQVSPGIAPLTTPAGK